MMKLWRELIVAEVMVFGTSLSVTFRDSVIGFAMSKKQLKEQGINWKHLTEGRRLLIRGRGGNEDFMLARPDALEGIILIPEKK